ncbi:MAG TPA: tetratricopeptide repeat protein, partial [Verrucomicrobiae bacterium]|nr:tetratricopeptide repeat protein [Verrucomicrobiae bacterium]
KSSSAQNNLGNALARKGEYGEAVVHFESALQVKPDYVEAQQNLATSYYLLGRMDEATRQFEAILKAHPDFEPARKGLARVMQRDAGSANP